MRAQLIRRFGGPEVFEPVELETPAPKRGEVLVRQVATSVNPVDTKIRARGPSIAPSLPAILGCDVAGIVEALGEGVDDFKVGDHVYGCAGGVRGMPGALAEFVATDARLLAPAPKTIPLREAAALPLVAITAWEGLVHRARIQPTEHILVHGGAGGVGHVVVQLAKVRGGRVAATVSTPMKAEMAKHLGADEIIDYTREPVADYVARLTAGKGFDVVFDATGGSDLGTSFEAACVNGRVVTIVSQYSADLTPMHLKGLSLHVEFMLIPMLHDTGRERHGRILREVARLVDSHQLRPLIDPTRFTLEQTEEAHKHLESGNALGKVVIDIAPA